MKGPGLLQSVCPKYSSESLSPPRAKIDNKCLLPQPVSHARSHGPEVTEVGGLKPCSVAEIKYEEPESINDRGIQDSGLLKKVPSLYGAR